MDRKSDIFILNNRHCQPIGKITLRKMLKSFSNSGEVLTIYFQNCYSTQFKSFKNIFEKQKFDIFS